MRVRGPGALIRRDGRERLPSPPCCHRHSRQPALGGPQCPPALRAPRPRCPPPGLREAGADPSSRPACGLWSEQPALRHPTFPSSCSPKVCPPRQIRTFYLNNDVLLTTRGPRTALPRRCCWARAEGGGHRAVGPRGRSAAREAPVTAGAVSAQPPDAQEPRAERRLTIL